MPLQTAKEKYERRIGERLFLKGTRSYSAKAAVARRPYPPGVHGKARRRGMSEYGTQLREKQKVRRMYGLSDTALKKYFATALKNTKKPTIDSLAEILERRLDNIVFRAGFAPGRSSARHLISYGHIFVNARRVKQPSFHVRVGDIVSLAPTTQKLPEFEEITSALAKHTPPEWLSINSKEKNTSMNRLPHLGDILQQQNMSLVVEYYTK